MWRETFVFANSYFDIFSYLSTKVALALIALMLPHLRTKLFNSLFRLMNERNKKYIFLFSIFFVKQKSIEIFHKNMWLCELHWPKKKVMNKITEYVSKTNFLFCFKWKTFFCVTFELSQIWGMNFTWPLRTLCFSAIVETLFKVSPLQKSLQPANTNTC